MYTVPDELHEEAKAALASWWADKMSESFFRQIKEAERFDPCDVHIPWWGGFRNPRGYSRAAIRWRRDYRRMH